MDSNISYCFKVDNGIFKHVGIIKKVINTEFGMNSNILCFKVDNGIFKHVEIIDGVINWEIYHALGESNTEVFLLAFMSLSYFVLHDDRSILWLSFKFL